MLKYLGMGNRPEDKVKVIFVPCYLDGRDGIMNKEYYDILLGQDLSVYASYYEPWGYTPLESVAFHVPDNHYGSGRIRTLGKQPEEPAWH